MIGIVCSLLLCITTTNAAVTWTQLTFKDGNPSESSLRPSISCDGKFAYYIHTCRTDDCQSEAQDGGSVYEVRLSNLTTTRIVTSAVGDSAKNVYVSSNETGSRLAIDSSDDLLGQGQDVEQVYIRNADGSFLRITSDESNDSQGHRPNISCDGNTVCWTYQGKAYCCNPDSCGSPTQIGTGTGAKFISPGSTGSTYVLVTTEQLAEPAPGEQMYYYNGIAWQRIGFFGGGNLQPRISKNGLSILFASLPENFGLASGSSTALKYGLETSIISKLFDDTPFQGTEIVTFATPDENLSDVVITSRASLAGTNPSPPGVEQIYHGRATGSDLIAQSGSPVNLVVTDPLGRKIGKGFSEIPEGTYAELDAKGDGVCSPNMVPGDPECQDRVTIDPRIAGNYIINVVPDPAPTLTPDPDATAKPGATPTPFPTATPKTYSLIIAVNDQLTVLASNAPVPGQGDPTPIYTPNVPPPQVTLNLVRGYVGSASGKYRLKGSFTAPEVKGPVMLAITDGTNTKTIDLGDTANYKKVSASVISTKIIDGASIIRIKFKKPAFDDWQVIIKGTKLDLAMFAGTSDSTIGYELTFGGVAYISEELFRRTGTLDLLFRVPR